MDREIDGNHPKTPREYVERALEGVRRRYGVKISPGALAEFLQFQTGIRIGVTLKAHFKGQELDFIRQCIDACYELQKEKRAADELPPASLRVTRREPAEPEILFPEGAD